MKTITFYSDSKIFGGHELMAFKIMKALHGTYNINVILSKYNNLFQEALNNEKIPYKIFDYKANKYQFLTNFFSKNNEEKLKELLNTEKTDYIILIQGNIDISFIGAKVADELRIPYVSYIPLTQPLKRVSRNKVIGYIKDILRFRSYKYINNFLTISKAQKENILKVDSNKQVNILPNYIDFSSIVKYNKSTCREEFNIPQTNKVIAYIGRFEAWHKGLDKYVKFLNQKADKYPDVVFLFVGEGIYRNKLQQLADSHTNIKIIDWTDNLNKIYSLVDAIIMPSRFEGVSLTMLEAIARDITIIANDIPEFQEFINTNNLFNLNDFNSISERIDKVVSNTTSKSRISPEDIYNEVDFKEKVLSIFSNYLSDDNIR